jgi:hypothetical protein
MTRWSLLAGLLAACGGGGGGVDALVVAEDALAVDVLVPADAGCPPAVPVSC